MRRSISWALYFIWTAVSPITGLEWPEEVLSVTLDFFKGTVLKSFCQISFKITVTAAPVSNPILPGIWLILRGINLIWFALRGISYSKHCHSAWYSLLELSSSCKEASLLALLSFPNNFLFYSFLLFLPLLNLKLFKFPFSWGFGKHLLWTMWIVSLSMPRVTQFLSFCLLAATKIVTCNSSFWTGLALLEILAISLLVNSMLTAMSTTFFGSNLPHLTFFIVELLSRAWAEPHS